MILPDQLTLLSRWPNGSILRNAAPQLAVAAGELAELALQGRVTLTRRDVVLLDRTSTGDPGLDSGVDLLAQAGKPIRVGKWLDRRIRGYKWRLDHLCSAGLLRYERKPVLGVFTSHRYLPDPSAHHEILTRIAGTLRGSHEPDPRATWLAALAGGSLIGGQHLHDRQDRKALKKVANADELARTVRVLHSARARGGSGNF